MIRLEQRKGGEPKQYFFGIAFACQLLTAEPRAPRHLPMHLAHPVHPLPATQISTMAMLAQDCFDAQIDLLCVQEHKLPGEGIRPLPSGVAHANHPECPCGEYYMTWHDRSVAIVMRRSMVSHLKSVEFLSDRVMMATYSTKPTDSHVICHYAPTQDHSEEEIEALLCYVRGRQYSRALYTNKQNT